MAKFAGNAPVNRVAHPIRTTHESVTNFEGSPAWGLDEKAELFLLAAVNMVGEDTFYESAKARDQRFLGLVHHVTLSDPGWIIGDVDNKTGGFARYLRGELKMRSASVVLACEYVAAGGPFGRQVIDAVCQRPDEPAEVLGYWLAKFGKKIPQPVKRGVADAARRLYTERNVIKWDSSRGSISFADVIELTHPKPHARGEHGPWADQGKLFKYLLDQAHHKDGTPTELLAEDAEWLKMPDERRRSALRQGVPSWWAWERLAGWLPGGMDAEAWEAVIPTMGVFALIRNLRNFDGKGISDKAIDQVIEKITDVEQVERSRIFPYNVWAAYREAPSDNWKRALGRTLEHATQNTPELPGRTLVLIDTSGSMQDTVSGRSTVQRIEVAAVMATAMAKKNANRVDIGIFGMLHARIEVNPGWSALDLTRRIVESIGLVGHSTMLNAAIAGLWGGHDRVIVFTDDQAQDNMGYNLSAVPRIYTFDLGGYGRPGRENGKAGRFLFGGFSDSALAAIPVIEAAGHAGWPF